MKFKINKFSIFLIVLAIIPAFNLTNEEEVNKFYQLINIFIIVYI